MTESKHTPTPWHSINSLCIGGPIEPGWEEAGSGVAHFGMRARTGEEAAANAALTLRAVNAFEPMREALRAAKRLCDNVNEFGHVTDQLFHDEADAAIRAALAKAQEGE